MFTTTASEKITGSLKSCLSFEREIRHPNGAFDNLWIFYQDTLQEGVNSLFDGRKSTYQRIRNLMEQFTVETDGEREMVGDLVEGMLRGRFSKKKQDETSWATWMERNRNLSMTDYETLIAYFLYISL